MGVELLEITFGFNSITQVRYKSDCEEFYGRILDNFDVVSTVQGICSRQTEEIWNKLYPDETYNSDLINLLPEDISERIARLEKSTNYDLISAVKRQSPFFYQVMESRVCPVVLFYIAQPMKIMFDILMSPKCIGHLLVCWITINIVRFIYQ